MDNLTLATNLSEHQITVIVDGQPLTAARGQTVAAMLMTHNRRIFRRTAKENKPRGLFCGMGICFDCLLTVNGIPNVRACVTPVTEGMTIETTVMEASS